MKTMMNNVKRIGISACMIGGCIAAIGTSAFAVQAEEPERVQLQHAEASVSAQMLQQADAYDGNAALQEKHQEIDAYVFEQHQGKFEDQGFQVTHTGPSNGSIEIGITPYAEEHVHFLQEQFGQDAVEVVEGVQAVTLIAEEETTHAASTDTAQARTKVVEYPDDPVSDAERSEASVQVDALPISAEVGSIAESSATEEMALETMAVQQESAAKSNSSLYGWAAAAIAAILGAGAMIWRKRTHTSK